MRSSDSALAWAAQPRAHRRRRHLQRGPPGRRQWRCYAAATPRKESAIARAAPLAAGLLAAAVVLLVVSGARTTPSAPALPRGLLPVAGILLVLLGGGLAARDAQRQALPAARRWAGVALVGLLLLLIGLLSPQAPLLAVVVPVVFVAVFGGAEIRRARAVLPPSPPGGPDPAGD